MALHSGGTSFDFAPDGSTYLAATDDGVVHEVNDPASCHVSDSFTILPGSYRRWGRAQGVGNLNALAACRVSDSATYLPGSYQCWGPAQGECSSKSLAT